MSMSHDASAGAHSEISEQISVKSISAATAENTSEEKTYSQTTSPAQVSADVAIDVKMSDLTTNPTKSGNRKKTASTSKDSVSTHVQGGPFAGVRVLGWKKSANHVYYIVQAELCYDLFFEGKPVGGRHLPPVSRRFSEFFELWKLFRTTFKKYKINVPTLPGKRILHGHEARKRRMNRLDTALMELNSMPNLTIDAYAKVHVPHITLTPQFLDFVGYTNTLAHYDIVGACCNLSIDSAKNSAKLGSNNMFLAKIYYLMLSRDSSGLISKTSLRLLHQCAMSVPENVKVGSKPSVKWTQSKVEWSWPPPEIEESSGHNSKWMGVNRSAFSDEVCKKFGHDGLIISGHAADSLGAALVTFDEFTTHWKCEPNPTGAKLFCAAVEQNRNNSIDAHFSFEAKKSTQPVVIKSSETSEKDIADTSESNGHNISESDSHDSSESNGHDISETNSGETVFENFLLLTPGLECLSNDKLFYALRACGVTILSHRQVKKIGSHLDAAHAHLLSIKKMTPSVGFTSKDEFVKLLSLVKSLAHLLFSIQKEDGAKSPDLVMQDDKGQYPEDGPKLPQETASNITISVVDDAAMVGESQPDGNNPGHEISTTMDIELGIRNGVQIHTRGQERDNNTRSLAFLSVLREIGLKVASNGHAITNDELLREILDRTEAMEIDFFCVKEHILKEVVNTCDQDHDGTVDFIEFFLLAGLLDAASCESLSSDSDNDPPDVVADRMIRSREELSKMESNIKAARNAIGYVLSFSLDPFSDDESLSQTTEQGKSFWGSIFTTEEMVLINDIVDFLYDEPFFHLSPEKKLRLSNCEYISTSFLPTVVERNRLMWLQESCKPDGLALNHNNNTENEFRSAVAYTPGLCGTLLGPTFPDDNYSASLLLSERQDALKLERAGDRLVALARLGFVHDCARILDECDNSEQMLHYNSKLDGVPRTPLHACCTIQSVHLSVAILLLRRGANPLEENANGNTFLDLLAKHAKRNTNLNFLNKRKEDWIPASPEELRQLQKRIDSCNDLLNQKSVRRKAVDALKSHHQALWSSILNKAPLEHALKLYDGSSHVAKSSNRMKEELVMKTLGRQQRLRISKSKDLRRQYFENVEILNCNLPSLETVKAKVTALEAKSRYFDIASKREAIASLENTHLDKLPSDVICRYPGSPLAEERIRIWSRELSEEHSRVQNVQTSKASPVVAGPNYSSTHSSTPFFFVYLVGLIMALSQGWDSVENDESESWNSCRQASTWMLVEITANLVVRIFFFFAWACTRLMKKDSLYKFLNLRTTMCFRCILETVWLIYGCSIFLSGASLWPAHLENCNQEMVVIGFVYSLFPGLFIINMSCFLVIGTIQGLCCGEETRRNGKKSLSGIKLIATIVFCPLYVAVSLFPLAILAVVMPWFWIHVIGVGEYYLEAFDISHDVVHIQNISLQNASFSAPAVSEEIPKICKDGAHWIFSLGIFSTVFFFLFFTLGCCVACCFSSGKTAQIQRGKFLAKLSFLPLLGTITFWCVGMANFVPIESRQYCDEKMWRWGFGLTIQLFFSLALSIPNLFTLFK